MDIKKGIQHTVTAKFYVKGSPAVFVQPPKWVLYNSEDEELLSGAASPNGNVWEANFTISNNYVVDGGKENLILQFTAHDRNNRSFTTDKELQLIDQTEEFKPDGVIYNCLRPGSLKDSINLPASTASFTVSIFDPTGKLIHSDAYTDLSSSSSNSYGYQFDFIIPDLAILKNDYLNPYQIMVSVNQTDGNTEDYFHPMYIMDMRTINVVNTLKNYLDKGKLVENDPTLQWQVTELMQAVLEGYKYINASPPEVTFWSAATLPSGLDQHHFNASAFFALNSRYLAEGLNAFEFSGSNTQLTFNRTEALQYKMSELQGLLERLPDIKKSAIAVAGRGTPIAGETNNRLANLGVLAITRNTMNNYGRNGFGRNRRSAFLY